VFARSRERTRSEFVQPRRSAGFRVGRDELRIYVVCPPGLEPYLAQEMKAAGLKPSRTFSEEGEDGGGVELEGEGDTLYRANLWLSTASRVLVRLGEFIAVNFPELRRKAGNLPWEQFLLPGQPVAVRVTSHASKLYMKKAIARHIQEGIGERLGRLPLDAPEAQLVLVRLARDVCTLSVDSSGEHLHRRGYKLAVTKAPLRENLAAGVILASGWQPDAPLLDPFCGSGTIPIEAARSGLGIPPGRMRGFQFQSWPVYDAGAWQALLQAADSRRRSTLAPIIASDRDAGAIQSARANAERAGVADYIQFTQAAVSAIQPPAGPGWVITNPPYGVRVSENKDLRDLYARFGVVLRSRCPGWQVAFLCPDDRLLAHSGLDVDTSLALVHGGLRVKVGRGRV